jgi:hypothetical protein
MNVDGLKRDEESLHPYISRYARHKTHVKAYPIHAHHGISSCTHTYTYIHIYIYISYGHVTVKRLFNKRRDILKLFHTNMHADKHTHTDVHTCSASTASLSRSASARLSSALSAASTLLLSCNAFVD